MKGWERVFAERAKTFFSLSINEIQKLILTNSH